MIALFDLAISGGRILDPSQNLDRVGDVAFKNGRVAEIGSGLSKNATETIDATGKLVTAGLIDLHGHYAQLVDPYSADPDVSCMPFGVTTCVDTGTVGWISFEAYRRYIIEKVDCRILAFLHLSSAGTSICQMRFLGIPDLEDFRLANAEYTSRCIAQNRDIVLGVKVRVSPDGTTEKNAIPALEMARKIADDTHTNVMVHVMENLVPMGTLFSYLRPGDLITHCFQGYDNNILDEAGDIRSEVWDAYKSGIIFDTASFLRHFSIPISIKAIESGLTPHTISSDRSIYKEDYMQRIRAMTGIPDLRDYDLLENMTMFWTMGMTLEQVIASVTVNAAKAIHRTDLGSLSPGAVGDAAILDVEEGTSRYADGLGNTITASKRFVPIATIKNGKPWKGVIRLAS